VTGEGDIPSMKSVVSLSVPEQITTLYMEQQTSHWITLTAALTVGLMILLFNLRPKKDRRSFGQWVILMLYRLIRFFWAIVRAADVAYLEYRRALQETPLEMENERSLGKIVKAAAHDETGVPAMHWDPAAN
jgi:prolipoprotein diacylglyceryltransferase